MNEAFVDPCTPDTDIVDIWMDSFLKDHPDPNREAINAEIEDVTAAISNERTWALGGSDAEQTNMYLRNVATYDAYLASLRKMLRDKTMEVIE